jgi:hypothetical protein
MVLDACFKAYGRRGERGVRAKVRMESIGARTEKAVWTFFDAILNAQALGKR